jgi:type I restriction enzyme S subunit
MEVTHLAADIELPAGWHQPRVIDIAARRANATVGGPFGSDLVAKDYVDSGVPVIRGQNMGHRYVSGEFAFVSPAKAKALQANLARPSDLVFTQRGTLGQVALVPTGPYKEYLISQSQMKLTLDCGAAAPGYVHQYFASALGQKQILDSAIQTGVPHTNLGILRNYAVPMPRRVDEQDAIAAALTDADALIDSLEQLLTKKRQIKQGAMQELLTGKRRLPGFTGKWQIASLGQVAKVKTGSMNNQDKVEDGEYPFFVRSQSVERIDTFTHDCEAILVPGEGGIGSIFHYIKGRFALHQRVYGVTDFSDVVFGRFLYFYIRVFFGAHAMENSVKATVDSLRLPTFLDFEIRLPPTKNEQNAIVEVLSDIESEVESLESRLIKARALKQAMAQALLTGRIRLAGEGANA